MIRTEQQTDLDKKKVYFIALLYIILGCTVEGFELRVCLKSPGNALLVCHANSSSAIIVLQQLGILRKGGSERQENPNTITNISP